MTESASRSSDSNPGLLALVRIGETVAGKYVIGRAIGIGGMGAVFEAQDTRLDRRVAIKFLLPQLAASPTAAGRFKREAKSATRITSEHVVKVLEIDDLPDGTPLLVMEYLEGEDLRELLRENGPLSPLLAVDYVMQALQAVAEGHNTGIVHRDLKPSNLFLTARADGTPLIKVLDFGIAKTLEGEGAFDPALTSTEDIQLGSPTYMPPEQFANPRDVDARSDIWALGVTLYELISGRVPFHGFNMPDLRSQVFHRAPESLQAFVPAAALPAGLEQIIIKCLEKERSARYLNARELAEALAPFGSADARVSLARISGLGRPRTPNPASPPRGSMMAYQATLPVPLEPGEHPHSGTSSGARAVPRVARQRGRYALAALGTGALLLAAGLVVARARWATDDRAPSPHGTASVTSSLSALQVESSHVQPALSDSSAPAARVKSPPLAGLANAGSGLVLRPPEHKPVLRPAERPAITQALQKPVLLANAAGAAAHGSAETARDSGAEAANAPPKSEDASAIGPSPLIESLIHERH